MAQSTGLNKIRTAIFISGNGSNLKSIIEFSKLKKSPISVNLIISDNTKSKDLEYGKDFYKKNNFPLFSSHMIDLSEEPLEENIATCKEYLKRLSDLDMTLEIELGVTGGEEDGVDNTDIDSSKLYTQPDEVAYAYSELISVSDKFIIAAAFGNVHGVYKPGNVKLTPKILKNSQEYVSKKFNLPENTLDFVFHGGSGSSVEEIREAISYGVIKMNIDTDLQFAFSEGVRDYMIDKKDYLMSQIGNPDGSDNPNKKFYDPRVWLRKGEETFKSRLIIPIELNKFLNHF